MRPTLCLRGHKRGEGATPWPGRGCPCLPSSWIWGPELVLSPLPGCRVNSAPAGKCKPTQPLPSPRQKWPQGGSLPQPPPGPGWPGFPGSTQLPRDCPQRGQRCPPPLSLSGLCLGGAAPWPPLRLPTELSGATAALCAPCWKIRIYATQGEAASAERGPGATRLIQVHMPNWAGAQRACADCTDCPLFPGPQGQSHTHTGQAG